jgi:threonyl-tRNA synthetase
MLALQKARLPLVRREVPIDDAITAMQAQPFKVELLNLLKERGSTAVAEASGDSTAVADGLESVSLYQLGDFVDLCRGPHVEHTGQTGVFKLTGIAGAYWRGDAKNPQLQRIYAFCFQTKEELDLATWQYEEAKLRDHRRLGKDLELFTFSDDVGAGLPLWLPKGTIVRDELEYLARREERKAGYQRVSTPHLTKERLYYTSGHLPYYAEDMYAPIKIEEENYYLRPMNCPHHHQIYMTRPRSYRELPLRIAEYGQVYRYEASGALSGLMRTRGFCQNDAHIYCTREQAEGEFLDVMHLHAKFYELFGIKDYYMRLSLPDLDKLDKYVNEPEEWRLALEVIRSAMKKSGYPCEEAKGEAAFYGPKVDFMIKSVIGSEFAISTNQLDFVASKKFNLRYIGEDGGEHPLYVIHRAPLGSHERFVAFLLEHYAGSFPTWLAPVQARVIPIADRHNDYGEEVVRYLSDYEVPLASGTIRADMNGSAERMQKKIRQAQIEKVPYMLVVGDRERETRTASVRLRNGADIGVMSLADIGQRIFNECASRQDVVTEAEKAKVPPPAKGPVARYPAA